MLDISGMLNRFVEIGHAEIRRAQYCGRGCKQAAITTGVFIREWNMLFETE